MPNEMMTDLVYRQDLISTGIWPRGYVEQWIPLEGLSPRVLVARVDLRPADKHGFLCHSKAVPDQQLRLHACRVARVALWAAGSPARDSLGACGAAERAAFGRTAEEVLQMWCFAAGKALTYGHFSGRCNTHVLRAAAAATDASSWTSVHSAAWATAISAVDSGIPWSIILADIQRRVDGRNRPRPPPPKRICI